MTALWPLGVVLGVAVVLLVLLRRGPTLFRGTREVSESFVCRTKQLPVDVEFTVDAWDAHRVDVAACSAFTPRQAVTCEKQCLKS